MDLRSMSTVTEESAGSLLIGIRACGTGWIRADTQRFLSRPVGPIRKLRKRKTGHKCPVGRFVWMSCGSICPQIRRTSRRKNAGWKLPCANGMCKNVFGVSERRAYADSFCWRNSRSFTASSSCRPFEKKCPPVYGATSGWSCMAIACSTSAGAISGSSVA